LILEYFDALFIFDVFKRKTGCHSVMDSTGHRALSKLIRDFSCFTIRNSVWYSPPTRYIGDANNICCFDAFNSGAVSV
jgi:hypothetical protein